MPDRIRPCFNLYKVCFVFFCVCVRYLYWYYLKSQCGNIKDHYLLLVPTCNLWIVRMQQSSTEMFYYHVDTFHIRVNQYIISHYIFCKLACWALINRVCPCKTILGMHLIGQVHVPSINILHKPITWFWWATSTENWIKTFIKFCFLCCYTWKFFLSL